MPSHATTEATSNDAEEHENERRKPTLEHVLDVEDPIEIGETGDGQRRIIRILGGTVSGRCEGHVLPGGADYRLFCTERPSELVAKYAFETDDGARMYVENRGIWFASPEDSERLRDGPPSIPTRSTSARSRSSRPPTWTSPG